MHQEPHDPITISRARDAVCRRMRLAAFAAAMASGVTLAAADDAGAEICKYIDSEGNTHYSNVAPDKGWRKLGCTAADDSTVRRSSNSVASRATPSPSSFPRVDTDTQRSRDEIRRKVLGDELAVEEKLLAESRIQYADGAPVPLPEERADAEKYRTRIARLRQSLTVHERNVDALKKELATVK